MPDSNQSRPNPLRRFFEGDLSRTLALGMIATFVCVLLIGWNLWGPHQTFQHASIQQEQLHRLIVSLTELEAHRDDANVAELARALDAYLRGDLDSSQERMETAIALSIFAGSVLLVMWAVVIRSIRRNLPIRAAELAERRALEDKLEYTQRLESLNVLAGGIAHDFNNLLTGILSNAGTARRKLAANDSAQQHLSEIVRGSKLAAHLTGQLLAYAGRGQFQVLARDLTAEVREIQDLLETSARTRANLDFQLAEDLPAILADPIQIQQVLMNLIGNASESGEGGVEVQIRTQAIDLSEDDLREFVPGSSLKPGRCVALDVVDNGSGMDAETIERIFDPFFTTKSAGRGLGLAASLGIIHRHKGGIQVTSRLGEGTSFRVVFPASGQIVRPPAERPVTDLSGHGVILVVDDDDYILQAVYVSLESYGYSVLLANSGAAAIQIFEERSEQIDLVLLDMLMPGMSGEETYRALRAIRHDVKVLLSTGFAPDEAAQRFTDEGLAGFLRKPYDPDQLAGEVQRIIERGSTQPSERMDEALRGLRVSYREKLPQQLDELTERLGAAREPDGDAAFRQAREISHRLAGTAGSYGLGDIGAELGKIDDALREVAPEDAAGARWRDIDAAVAEIRGHLSPGDKP
ncbi:MAG: response regulator [Deltaproteobacteria bacterium]|nr:response regulator [Deltaproteobacteria bacterium]MBW2694154.1 response regulator [Deltaproteobacteria bacterium]